MLQTKQQLFPILKFYLGCFRQKTQILHSHRRADSWWTQLLLIHHIIDLMGQTPGMSHILPTMHNFDKNQA